MDMKFLRDAIDAAEGSDYNWRAGLQAAAFVGVMALVLFLIFVLPRLIGGVVG
jgi:hypothetical protein